MLSPVDALKELRDQMVMNRRKIVDQQESIKNVQAEIEAIDRAVADEESISRKAGSKAT
ncbi:hypothetical protein SAMN02799625_05781 [Methylobacterium sp. UNC300MFChir4.1]|uniref:hypothetical protein n=1 Tax=unclassified Methylobacterium TaxID=2615210 RepID=UPI0008D87A38|nr:MULTISPECIES: hypothetical protein [unclassified Methylobacterium]SEP37504.1 hypothetical protein SAMN02799625_05781 [Methylobacterium sp. UNC300MFChir4.1]SFT28107.1 hypothetical protein SAMN04487845_14325 [Methylobacterium sp. yr668]